MNRQVLVHLYLDVHLHPEDVHVAWLLRAKIFVMFI